MRFLTLSVLFLVMTGLQPCAAFAKDKQVIVVSERVYSCLMKHRQRMKANVRGVVFDLKDCPNRIKVIRSAISIPNPPPGRFLTLTGTNIACLKKIRQNNRPPIAQKQADGTIVLYLDGCI